jgi:tRNA (guanine10-N2)-methyltransferase
MLDDILHFAAQMLVDNGRLAMWMPTANDDNHALSIPQNPHLELKSCCVQDFNKCEYISPEIVLRNLTPAQ